MLSLCPDGLLPDGPTCPRCGGTRGPSGVNGGSWVHCTPSASSPPLPAALTDAVREAIADLREAEFESGMHRSGRHTARAQAAAEQLTAILAAAHPPALPAEPVAWYSPKGCLYRGAREEMNEAYRIEGWTPLYLGPPALPAEASDA